MQCRLCPLACGADRERQAGRCGVKGLTVAKYYLHPFEEPCISFQNGSGTVFFCGCSLRCVFCQNYELSRAARGKSVTPKELSKIFQKLEAAGADNINLVTPDHVAPLIAEALALYRPKVPVVYNSSGYARVSTLEEISPYIDVWLPDFKFASFALAERYTGRRDYPAVARDAVAFMAQKPVVWSEDKKLLSGALVRHLVLPSHTEDSKCVLDILKTILPNEVPLSIMRQYTPMGDLAPFPELKRAVTDREYARVTDYALSLGFENVYTQEKESVSAAFIPKWDF